MLEVKNLPANMVYTRDIGFDPGSGRSPGAGSGNPSQYSCLESSMARVWWATVHGVAKSRTLLNTHTQGHTHTRTHTRTHTHKDTHTQGHTHTRRCGHGVAKSRTLLHTHTRRCGHGVAKSQTLLHTHTNTHTHTHTHTEVWASQRSFCAWCSPSPVESWAGS